MFSLSFGSKMTMHTISRGHQLPKKGVRILKSVDFTPISLILTDFTSIQFTFTSIQDFNSLTMYFQRTIRVLLCEWEKGLVQLRDNLRSMEVGDFGICIANEFNGCFRGSDSLRVANFLKFGQILVCCFHLLGNL